MRIDLIIISLKYIFASVAHWTEQQFPVLRVGGSIPLGGTKKFGG